MHILLYSLLMLTHSLLAQGIATQEVPVSDLDDHAKATDAKQTAELFLSACVQRDWKKASGYLSSTSPLVLSDNRTAADAWLVGRLKKYEIRTIDEEESPTAVAFGCAKLGGRGRGTFRFLMTLVTDKEKRKIYHFELERDGMELPPAKCSLQK